jgi:glycosyltransferase involved in cell wall biosynthesis
MHGIEWQRTRWSSFGKNMLKMFEWLSLKGSHTQTAVSKTQCNFYQAQKGMSMRYIPTGAEIKELRPAQEILKMGLEAGKYILFASRLVREKGAHYLIPAFQQLGTDFKLVIAGDAKGEEEYKCELRDLAGSDPRIIFPGFVEGQALGPQIRRGIQQQRGVRAFDQDGRSVAPVARVGGPAHRAVASRHGDAVGGAGA